MTSAIITNARAVLNFLGMGVAARLYELALGGLLLLAPWSRLWRDNWFIWVSGDWRGLLESGSFRGAVSGLGAALVLLGLSGLARVELTIEDAVPPPGNLRGPAVKGEGECAAVEPSGAPPS